MPDDRTPDEKKAGFDYDAADDAVVYNLSPTDRIKKLTDPTGNVTYPVHRHGRLPFEDPSTPGRWIPIHSGIPISPEDAVHRAKKLATGPPEQIVVSSIP